MFPKENLISLQSLDELQQQVRDSRQSWDKQIAQLPGENEFKAYETQLGKLKIKGNGSPQDKLKQMSEVIKQLQSLKKNAAADIDHIKKTKKSLEVNLNDLGARLTDITKTPSQDFQRLKQKYTLSSSGVTNISQLLFGYPVSNWVDTAITWYSRLMPVLEKTGRNADGGKGGE